MRLHTRLTYGQVYQALNRAQGKGRIAPDVEFVIEADDGMIGPYVSHTHARAFEIQLGTYDQHSLPAGYTDQNGHKMKVRRYKNTGGRGASSKWVRGEAIWAATYDEWGWLIMEVFEMDPSARWGGAKHPAYADLADFHVKTANRFREQAKFDAAVADMQRVSRNLEADRT